MPEAPQCMCGLALALSPPPGGVKGKRQGAFAILPRLQMCQTPKDETLWESRRPPGGVLPVPWARLQGLRCSLLGSPAGHACCLGTMPLCGRPTSSARAWACLRCRFLPLCPGTLAGVDTHDSYLLARPPCSPGPAWLCPRCHSALPSGC